MVTLSVEQWQHQSALLLQARPSTTHVTTKYNVPNLDSAKYQGSQKRKRDVAADEKAAAPRVPRAILTLRTYDPQSGVVLKCKTDKAADVGRLINGLARLGRHMAALPEKTEGSEHPVLHRTVLIAVTDVDMPDATAATREEVVEHSSTPNAPVAPQEKSQQGSGGGKKKKKGKK